jgi:hypothetical protein
MYEDLRCLISENQLGYMQGRSTVKNFIEYVSFILKAMEEGFQVDSIYTDFSKAFVKVLFAFAEICCVCLSHRARFAPFLFFWQDSTHPNWQLCFKRDLGDV